MMMLPCFSPHEESGDVIEARSKDARERAARIPLSFETAGISLSRGSSLLNGEEKRDQEGGSSATASGRDRLCKTDETYSLYFLVFVCHE